ncbi:SagB/ThcOx family dehydrogenase [Thermococcus sp.]|uniref:SagB/ThcOx family dehydrogenase n=1 Tax=Thermococcus sp. TaxID=35749 RepID=UPI00260CA8EC|nr:SagB/ThcOx family dehydrogenase [Thermococcus sp.]
MRLRHVALLAIVLSIVFPALLIIKPHLRSTPQAGQGEGIVPLPEPRLTGGMSVEEAIAKRRSIRSYRDEPLTLEELSQLLWAAQGITDWKRKYRSAPSAGPTYPFEIYAVVGNVRGLSPGIYRYDPFRHALIELRKGDFRRELQKASLNQEWVGEAPLDIVLVAFYERTTRVYGERGIRYVHMEAGHIGENIYLEATSLGLGTVAVGAFDDERVAEILGTLGSPLYIFPVGVPSG